MRCAGVFRLAESDSEAVCTAAILSRPCPLWVKSGHRGELKQCPLYPQKQTWISTVVMKQTFPPCYSIKSSASESIDAGIVSPSAFAVVRLITSSNLVGCCTGK